MDLIEFAPSSVAEKVALDESLLLRAEEGAGGEAFRLWTTDEYAVVLGRGGKPATECHVERCRRDGVSILRRVSGGGTVLMGPGCLNFALVLSFETNEAYRNVLASYAAILEPIAEALRKRGIAAEVMPKSDIAVAGRKISGNAQARKRRFFLHHGTFLCGFDLAKIGKYLRHPPREPDYRGGRPHGDFVTNVPGAHSSRNPIGSIGPISPMGPMSLIGIDEMGDILREAFRPSNCAWRPADEDLARLREIAARREAEVR